MKLIARNFLSVILYIILLCSCSPVSKHALNKVFVSVEKKFQEHAGFMLYDPATKKILYEYNGRKYFTPGSNTKIFTFFACLNIIKDSIPGLKFITRGDSLIFEGTGDPSFLYKNVFNNSRTYDFLKNARQQLYFSPANFQTTHFGPGWAWDDYNDYYSTERFGFPVYGNIFSILESGKNFKVTPGYFRKYLLIGDKAIRSKVTRRPESNQIEFLPGNGTKEKVWDVPFKTDPLLITTLLTDTLSKEVLLDEMAFPPNAVTFYSTPADSLYRVMMQDSDNFIAEQLLLTCAGILSDTLKSEIAIDYVKKNFLSDSPDKPIWVDGSGLSRYNLFTPRSIVGVWEKIYKLVPQQRLFSLLAIGGKTGTLRNWYKSDKPYIFGKTGTLSNNHCLSGYLVTKKGKTLIFSFMNNNFIASTGELRSNMQEVLMKIHENY